MDTDSGIWYFGDNSFLPSVEQSTILHLLNVRYCMRATCFVLPVFLLAAITLPAGAQTADAPATPVATPVPSLPPATRLEGFKPAAGSVVTIGYTDLGVVSSTTVATREARTAQGARIRGMTVDVRESQYREARSFVDADELPELVRGIDALLGVTANPTASESFEVRYTTRGQLELIVFNQTSGRISYALKAGRVSTATDYLNADEMRRLRELFVGARDAMIAPASN